MTKKIQVLLISFVCLLQALRDTPNHIWAADCYHLCPLPELMSPVFDLISGMAVIKQQQKQWT